MEIESKQQILEKRKEIEKELLRKWGQPRFVIACW